MDSRKRVSIERLRGGRMSICKQCNGSGKTYNPGYGEEDCCRCHGTGEIKQTNEEWFCQLSTVEKAKWLNQQMMYAAREQGYFTVDGLMKWLKEKHDE